MLNATIISFNVLLMIKFSPFYTLSLTHQSFPQTKFINSHFSRFFPTVFSLFTPNHEISFQNCLFSQILDSSIKTNDDSSTSCILKISNKTNNSFEYGTPIENELIDDKSYFKISCGNITINGCIFNGCHATKSFGGSLEIKQKCFVLIHNTIFNNSSTDQNCGGSCYIAKSQGDDGATDFEDKQLPRLDVQNYGNDKTYGVALFSASKKMIFYFTSSVNCPCFQHSISSGAQFDMQSDNVTSKYVNATQGRAIYCSGIEYRRASNGLFKFQTISQMSCMFAVAYTDIKANDLDLSYSNIFNISLRMLANATKLPNLYPGTIHVRKTDTITLDHFCFFDIDFGQDSNNSKLISRGTDLKTHNVQLIRVVLVDCSNFYVAVDYSPNIHNQELIRCNSNTVKSNHINQLDLGECRGKVTPPPLETEPTKRTITKPIQFSTSKQFTKTKQISKTIEISKPIESPENSELFEFSDSDNDSEQIEFPETFDIFNSEEYSNSNLDSDIETFSESDWGQIYHPIDNHKEKENKVYVALIAGITGGGGACIIAGIIAAVVVVKKNKKPVVEDIEMASQNCEAFHNENILFDKDAEDDPFRDDFVEQP